MRAHRNLGFTIVEMITVVVLLGILSIGTVRFLSDSSSGLASTMSRTKLASDARIAVDRVSMSLRDALPDSVRVTGDCLEYIPIVAATTYITLPVSAAASTFRVVPFDPVPAGSGLRAAVYAGSNAHNLGSPGEISGTVSLSAPDVNNEVTVTLAGAHQFSSASPTRRLFLVQSPVSYCVDATQLWRYTNYGYLAAQPGIADLPNVRPNRTLMAQGVASLAPFILQAPSLSRSAVVQIDMSFTRQGDTVRMQDQVQVRNVP